MDPTRRLRDAALADKMVARRQARALAWPEKIKVIERLRDATRKARASMCESRRKDRGPGGRV